MQSSTMPSRLVLGSLIFLALGALAPVNAQDTDSSDRQESRRVRSGGAGFFSIGANFADIGPLNRRLDAAGYPTFSSEMVSVGGGGYGITKSGLMIGGEGHGLVTGDAGFQGRTVSVSAGYGLFTLGYAAYSEHNFRLSPQVGLGGAGLALDIESSGAENFNDVLENPNRSATVGTASMVVSLGAGAEYHFRRAGEKGGFLIGLRAGYLFSALTSDWKLDESSLGNGPDATISGPFIRLVIGGGGSGDADDE